jgi:hypothetical protein
MCDQPFSLSDPKNGSLAANPGMGFTVCRNCAPAAREHSKKVYADHGYTIVE